MPKKILAAIPREEPDEDKGTSITNIRETYTEEIIIGLCGHIGTNIHLISKWIKEILEQSFKYECHIITLSDYIRKLKDEQIRNTENGTEEFNRVFNTIRAGNALRGENLDNSILSMLAIMEIAKKRSKDQKKEGLFESRRICYIIDSIKHQEELELFRIIYRDIMYFIGVFSPINIRIDNLIDRNIAKHEITKLINIDSGEEISHGQKVTKTFTNADYFLRIDYSNRDILENRTGELAKRSIQDQLKRFFNLILGNGIITPTKDETAMYLASSAAKNSACLSRQVGAAITDENGDVIAVGWNDVPKYGGNLYQGKNNYEIDDFRCMNFENHSCVNDDRKKKLSVDIVDQLIEKKVISELNKKEVLEIMSKSKIGSLIEYCRAVHAEMHALIIGSQNTGKKMKGGALFCTTYPCHNCARHLVLAGIKKIYYIEPYRKSLSIDLHNDSITENENENKKVVILMYNGVAPRRYMELFSMENNPRKYEDSGKVLKFDLSKLEPKDAISLEAIPTLESLVLRMLKNKGIINES